MWLLVGLGNPGPEHACNRHNVGFRVMDALAARSRVSVVWRNKMGAAVAETAMGDERALLCKPMEFMNVSGQAVARVSHFWKIPPQRLVVVHDELDVPFERLKLGQGGGHGGHNGIRSLIAELGTPSFARVRFGVGRPPAGHDAAAYVLADFNRSEEALLPELTARAAAAVEAIARDGVAAAMNQFNGKASANEKKNIS